ncbi:MAG: hypothetical protein AzoDbin1_04115 [Azoarcus sp.]|nr:hypothetical protein [Azoarcus sp.]
MSKIQRTARVRITAHVGGERIEYAIGDRLPDDFPAHDIEQLKRMGSIDEVEVDELASAKEADAAGGVSAGTNTTASGSSEASGGSPDAGAGDAAPASEAAETTAKPRAKK